MKNIKLLFCIISILLVIVLISIIVYIYVTMKSEFAEMPIVPANLHAYYVEQYLNGQIRILYYFLSYVFINLIFLTIFFFCKK